MTGKGCAGAGTFVGIEPKYGVFYSDTENYLLKMGISQENIIPKVSNGSGRSTGAGGAGARDTAPIPGDHY